jgi:DNA polymerase
MSGGCFIPGLLQSKSASRAGRKPKVRTYDVGNAGPRNRFTVMTGRGPLIVHNCGYGLGAKGLVAYAAGMFVEMSEDQAQTAVNVFRDTYHEVPRLWRLLEKATTRLVREKSGRLKVGRLRFEYDNPFLFMVLPSGRKLAYLHPRVEKKPAPWGDEVDTMTYMGLDQYTRQWGRMSTFGGKWVEQACQAISRDLLAYGMAEADALGFEVVGSTHDELIALTDEDDWLDADALSYCMTRMPPWGDSRLYLDAEGYDETIYRKG